jgi:hypothetical protein
MLSLVSLSSGCSAPPPPALAPVVQAPTPAPVAETPMKRISRDGTGGFILPDGTRVAGDAEGGFTLPNGDYVAADGDDGLLLPNGVRCTLDRTGGYVCP